MSRYIAKTDGNHEQIIDVFRRRHATVISTHVVGQGFPDLVVGYRGYNLLVEVKDPARPPGKRQLTPMQAIFFQRWAGQVCVVQTMQDVLSLLDALDRSLIEGKRA